MACASLLAMTLSDL